MAGKSYSELLRDPRWQRVRLETLKRDDWRCVWCRDNVSNLQVDHKRYVRGRKPWEYGGADLQTLCERCHKRVTELRAKVADLLGDFTVYELPAVISAIERMSGNAAPPSPPRLWLEEAPVDVEVPSRPVMGAADLAALEREKRILLAQPWSSVASRRVEELDEMTGSFWDGVALARAA